MAIGIELTFDGATQEQYAAMQAKLAIDRALAAGLIFHASGPVDDGWRVVDFWESREAFDAFFAERLQPTPEELAGEAPLSAPRVEEFPVHGFARPSHLDWRHLLNVGERAWSRAGEAVTGLRTGSVRHPEDDGPDPEGAPTALEPDEVLAEKDTGPVDAPAAVAVDAA